MNGRVVHSWPEARAKSRLRLLEDGSLLGLSLRKAVVEYDWDGNLAWEYNVEGGFAHHDVVRLENGNTLFPVLLDGRSSDDLFEVRSARPRGCGHGARAITSRSGSRTSNRAAALTSRTSTLFSRCPPNHWFVEGDERFRPGNLLISARNLNSIFVLDRETGAPVWHYDSQLDLQHEALNARRISRQRGKHSRLQQRLSTSLQTSSQQL